MSKAQAPLLSIDKLDVHFPVAAGLFRRSHQAVHAVNGLSLELHKGECLSVVGESGCGKSTLALSIVGLQQPTNGSISVEGKVISGKNAPARLERAGIAQMVFQDPFASLNPRQTIFTSLGAPLKLQTKLTASQIREKVEATLKMVGLKPEHAERLPHEFSGGQRQRIGIARALILEPKIIVLDEPVSALDVSIRAQIINLLLELKDKLGLSYIMISHDLSVVEHMSDRVAVMYFGQIVEEGPWQKIFNNPLHPYTRRLMSAIPDPFAFLNEGETSQQQALPVAPNGYEFYPNEFGKHDVYKAPPPSELHLMEAEHRVRLAAAG